MLRGIDISHHRPVSDFNAMASFCDFAFCKLTEGTTWRDPYASTFLNGCRGKPVVVGLYHFLRVESDAAAQCRWFLDNAGGPDALKGKLVALDVERRNFSGGTYSDPTRATVEQWIAEFRRHTDHRLIVYTGRWWWTPRIGVWSPPGTYLWHSSYTDTPGPLYGNWKQMAFWQYTNGEAGPQPHSCPGVGPCDINQFFGNDADLRILTGEDMSPAEIAAVAKATADLIVARLGTDATHAYTLVRLRAVLDELTDAVAAVKAGEGPGATAAGVADELARRLSA